MNPSKKGFDNILHRRLHPPPRTSSETMAVKTISHLNSKPEQLSGAGAGEGRNVLFSGQRIFSNSLQKKVLVIRTAECLFSYLNQLAFIARSQRQAEILNSGFCRRQQSKCFSPSSKNDVQDNCNHYNDDSCLSVEKEKEFRSQPLEVGLKVFKDENFVNTNNVTEEKRQRCLKLNRWHKFEVGDGEGEDYSEGRNGFPTRMFSGFGKYKCGNLNNKPMQIYSSYSCTSGSAIYSVTSIKVLDNMMTSSRDNISTVKINSFNELDYSFCCNNLWQNMIDGNKRSHRRNNLTVYDPRDRKNRLVTDGSVELPDNEIKFVPQVDSSGLITLFESPDKGNFEGSDDSNFKLPRRPRKSVHFASNTQFFERNLSSPFWEGVKTRRKQRIQKCIPYTVNSLASKSRISFSRAQLARLRAKQIANSKALESLQQIDQRVKDNGYYLWKYYPTHHVPNRKRPSSSCFISTEKCFRRIFCCFLPRQLQLVRNGRPVCSRRSTDFYCPTKLLS